jgi:hypothetical protein
MMVSKLGIRWDRVFTVSGEGKPQSYFNISYLLLLYSLLENIFGKKRKAKNS